MLTYSKHRLDENGNPTMYLAYRCTDISRNSQRGVMIGDPAPKGWYLTKEEAIAAHEQAKEVEHKEYLALKPEAEKQLDRHEEFLQSYLKDNKVSLDYTMLGDTHGIYEDYMYISISIGKHRYERCIDF